MTELVLARHGETIWHAENRYAGSSDVPLNAMGQRQATLLARWARSAHVDAVWSSPTKCAHQTAVPAARAVQSLPRIDDRLRDQHFGSGEGRTISELRRSFPDAVRAHLDDPATCTLPGADPLGTVLTRAHDCVRDIVTTLPAQGRVLVVTHDTVIRLLLCEILGVPVGNYRKLFPAVHSVGLTHLRWRHGVAAVLAFNSALSTAPGWVDAAPADELAT